MLSSDGRTIDTLKKKLAASDTWEDLARECLEAAYLALADGCTESAECVHCQIAHCLG